MGKDVIRQLTASGFAAFEDMPDFQNLAYLFKIKSTHKGKGFPDRHPRTFLLGVTVVP